MKPKKEITFTIFKRLPRNNDFIGMHWAMKNVVKDNWKSLIWESFYGMPALKKIGLSSPEPFFDKKVKIDIECCFKDKRNLRDDSNIMAMVDKLIIDRFSYQKSGRRKLQTPKPPVVHLLKNDTAECVKWGEIKQLIDTPERITISMEEI